MKYDRIGCGEGGQFNGGRGGGGGVLPLPSSSSSSSSSYRHTVTLKAAPKQRAATVDWARHATAVMYGVVNAIMCIPVAYGYASIIFSHAAFRVFMPALCKLVLFSCCVHQVSFSVLSSLPFAIGQVQDAGLIFLSKMATSIASELASDGDASSPAALQSAVATCVVGLGVGTCLLGVALVFIGKQRLASYVTYLPMPVIGGYLAFIGFFCLEAGLGLCIGESISAIGDLAKIDTAKDVVLILPGIVCGTIMCVTAHRFDHWAALPGVMVAVPSAFYVILGVSGCTLDDARAYGWVGPVKPPARFDEVFDLYRFDLVEWSLLPSLLPVWAGMLFVVAFSSCLDVAAIEMDMGQKLDTNHELVTVGVGNVLSGAAGGFTGSYIFSQTIFTYRTKTNCRTVGIVVLLSEMTVFLLNSDPMALVPAYFFASTLIFIAFDLMWEWLVLVRHKVLPREYFVVIVTFLAINALGLDEGMIAGIGVAALNFILSHSRVKITQRVAKRSQVVRLPAQEQTLAAHRDSILCFELRGSIFFGSSLQILGDIKRQVKVPSSAAADVRRAKKGLADGASPKSPPRIRRTTSDVDELGKEIAKQQLQTPSRAADYVSLAAGRSMMTPPSPALSSVGINSSAQRPPSMPLSSSERGGAADYGAVAKPKSESSSAKQRSFERVSVETADGHAAGEGRPSETDSGEEGVAMAAEEEPLVTLDGMPVVRDTDATHIIRSLSSTSINSGASSAASTNGKGASRAQGAVRTRYLVLDFAQVPGIDATAANSCFLPLQKQCARNHVHVAFVCMSNRIDWLLRRNGVLTDPFAHTFGTLDAALDWCETDLLQQLRVDDHRFPSSPGSYLVRQQSFRSRQSVSLVDVLSTSLNVAGGGGVAMGTSVGSTGGRKPSAATAAAAAAAAATTAGHLKAVHSYCSEVSFPKHTRIFSPGDTADRIYVLLSGTVVLEAPAARYGEQWAGNAGFLSRKNESFESLQAQHASEHGPGAEPSFSPLFRRRTGVAGVDGAADAAVAGQRRRSASGAGSVEPSFGDSSIGGEDSGMRLMVELHVGAIFGDTDFFLEQPRTFFASAGPHGCTVSVFSRARLERMFEESPRLFGFVQKVIVKHMALEARNAIP